MLVFSIFFYNIVNNFILGKYSGKNKNEHVNIKSQNSKKSKCSCYERGGSCRKKELIDEEFETEKKIIEEVNKKSEEESKEDKPKIDTEEESVEEKPVEDSKEDKPKKEEKPPKNYKTEKDSCQSKLDDIERKNNLLPDGKKFILDKTNLENRINSINSDEDFKNLEEGLTKLEEKEDEKLGELKTEYNQEFEKIENRVSDLGIVVDENLKTNINSTKESIENLDFNNINDIKSKLQNLKNTYFQKVGEKLIKK